MNALSEETVIRFEEVQKEYRLGKSVHPTLKEWLLRPGARSRRKKFRALDRVSFSVVRGQVLGLIGENGSGKSTILKLIAGVSHPDRGQVQVSGRVSSLLEIGTGFHPEMTGRENVFLSGALLGISQSVLEDSFEDIVQFAELEDFIDTPVKHYSSGMYMRLGFSVATRVDPDILLIDEVLAVGDEIFQKKCKEVILQMAARGKTLIFVSHDLGSVAEICNRCLLIEKGQIVTDGLPREAIYEYHKRTFDRKASISEKAEEMPWFTRAGTMEVKINEVRLSNQKGEKTRHFSIGEPIAVEIEYECRHRVESAGFGLSISRDDQVLFGTTTFQCGVDVPPLEPGEGRVHLHFNAPNLMPGSYFMTVNVFPMEDLDAFLTLKFHNKIFDLHSKQHPFLVEGENLYSQLEGTTFLEHTWEVDQTVKKIGFPDKM
jgi:lipopolysaccharide transport system ATP-binding protein